MANTTRGNGRRITGVRALPILSAVFVTIGLVGLLAGGAVYLVESHSARNATSTGTIVDDVWYPLVEFRAEAGAGATWRFRSSVRSAFLKNGDSVPVAYDPANPADAAVDGIAGRFLLSAIFGGLGCAFGLIGSGLFVASRLLRRSRAS